MNSAVHKKNADEILRDIRAKKACPPLDLRVLADSDGLTAILALPRKATTWERLTVVFASHYSCQPAHFRFEFRGTVVKSQQPALFVFDQSLRWYVEAGMYDRVCRLLREQMAALGVAELVTIGDSMGGYAALAYAQDLPVSYALAITTRGSIGPDGVVDPRHQPQLLADGLDLRAPNLRRALGKIPAGAMIHGTRGADRLHFAELRGCGAVDHWVVPGRGHGVAAWMKQNDILFPVAAAALRADGDTVNKLLKSRGALRRESISSRVRLTGLRTLDRLRSLRDLVGGRGSLSSVREGKA